MASAKKSRVGDDHEVETLHRNNFVRVSRSVWAADKQSEMWSHFAFVIHVDLWKEGEELPPSKAIGSKGFYVCMHEASNDSADKVVCAQWLAFSGGPSTLKRHLDSKHNHKYSALANPAASGSISKYVMLKATLASGLATTQFTNPDAPLRVAKVVPEFMSHPTANRIAKRIVADTLANLVDALTDRVVSLTFDFSPLGIMEFGVLNIHVFGKKYETLMVALQQVTGSLTSDELVRWVHGVLEAYGIVSASKLPTNARRRSALALFSCTDSGANAAKAAKEVTKVTLPHRLSLPELNTHAACAAHVGNLLIRDAFNHASVRLMLMEVLASIKTIRKQRQLAEQLAATGIRVPGRAVTSRWRTLMNCVKYVVQNNDDLKAVDSELGLSDADVSALGIVHGVLAPFDLLITQLQSNSCGDGLFAFHKIVKAVGVLRTGDFQCLVPNTKDTTATKSTEFGTVLGPWYDFVVERAMARYLSHQVIEDEEGSDDDVDEGPSRDEEEDNDDDLLEADETNVFSDDEEEGEQRDRASGRFKRNNYIVHAAVIAIWALSPLKSPVEVAKAEGALHPRDLPLYRDLDITKNVLSIRHLVDPEWAELLSPRESEVGSRSVPRGAGAAGLLARVSRTVHADPVRAALDDITRFQNHADVMSLFVAILAPPPAEDAGLEEVQGGEMDVEDGVSGAQGSLPVARGVRKGKGLGLTAQEDEWMHTWVELGDKHCPWIGRVLRALLAAPLRSTVCESNFSVVSHILAPRRLRMGPVMLAATMFCKMMPQYVQEPPDVPRVTTAGTKPIETFMARKGQPRVASASSATTSTGTSSAHAVRVEEEEEDDNGDGDEEEPDMQHERVTTRSGRLVRVLRPVALASRVLPQTIVVRARGGRAVVRTLDEGDDDGRGAESAMRRVARV